MGCMAPLSQSKKKPHKREAEVSVVSPRQVEVARIVDSTKEAVVAHGTVQQATFEAAAGPSLVGDVLHESVITMLVAGLRPGARLSHEFMTHDNTL